MAQATVSRFDPSTQAGEVLLDDGTTVPFPADAFALSGLRLLRPGQRVRIDRDSDGTVTRVTLFTLA
jgi:2-phospho-L-lactate/phosphoenolpyruvate guanylyltransferase